MSTELTPSMRRSVLIAALRDPTTWPPGFKWDFGACATCAMGLLHAVMKLPGHPSVDVVRQPLGITTEQAWRAFCCSYPNRDGGRAWSYVEGDLVGAHVTPAMVADRLEAIHRELESAESHPARPWSS